MSIASRLAALERVEDEGVTVVLVVGGLPDPEPLALTLGAHRLEQGTEETSGAFCERVRVAAVRERLKGIIVLGGLPKRLDSLVMQPRLMSAPIER